MKMKQNIQNELTAAMKARDEDTKRTLRLVMSAIKLVEVEKRTEIDDNRVLSILQKEVKTRQDAIEEAQRANRADLIEAAEKEIIILQQFLPQQMSDDEINNMVKGIVDETGATGLQDMGEVMKNLMPKLAGRASGQQASKIVRDYLQKI